MANKKPAPKKAVKATKPTVKSAKKVTTKPIAKAIDKKAAVTKVVKAPAKKVAVVVKK